MVFTLCALFLSIPAVAATESKNTENTVFAKATTDQNLKIGMEGDNVIELQKWLTNQGFYTGKIDGKFGNYTEQAVINFQIYTGIKPDGIVGMVTMKHMHYLVNGNTNPNYNSDTSPTGSGYSTVEAAYGTRNYYPSAYSSGSRWSSGRGTGDCWQNSYALYNQLTASGTKSRIVQYANGYSPNHRSVEVWNGNKWVDYDYRRNGYSNRYYPTKHGSSAKVIKSS
ncbi:MAG TPA: peptidoglycan-binding protein [Methanobacterium sp.]|jgi:N-acetylmuramoyl-L-alanine amidase|nr:peptidoglycan-binding protein [Methanobacterium sp.]